MKLRHIDTVHRKYLLFPRKMFWGLGQNKWTWAMYWCELFKGYHSLLSSSALMLLSYAVMFVSYLELWFFFVCLLICIDFPVSSVVLQFILPSSVTFMWHLLYHMMLNCCSLSLIISRNICSSDCKSSWQTKTCKSLSFFYFHMKC